MKKVLQQPSASLNRLLQHNQYLDYLSKRLLTYLPTEFSNKISVLGFSKKASKNKQQSLIILADSPAWASKLRFYIPTLKRSLRAEPQFNLLSKIVIRTVSSDSTQKKDTPKPLYSQKSASIIHDSAQYIDDAELKEALIRLAHNIKKPSKL